MKAPSRFLAYPDAGKDGRQEEKGMTENEVVGWHLRLNGHAFEQTLGDGEGQRSLACCSPWGHQESDTNEKLNNNKNQSHPGVPFVGVYGYIPITHIFFPYHFSEGHICKGPS